jgi:hypothetical protein
LLPVTALFGTVAKNYSLVAGISNISKHGCTEVGMVTGGDKE